MSRRLLPRGPLALLVLALLFVLAVIASNLLTGRARLDLTEDRLYTLSPGAVRLLAALPASVKLTLYFSEQETAAAPQINLYGRRVADLLEAFVRASDGKLRVKRVDPEAFSATEDAAVAAGLRGVDLGNGTSVYLGLVGERPASAGRPAAREVIPFLAPDREPQLEYDLARLIQRLTTPELPRVAVLSSLPLAFGHGGPVAMMQGQSAPYVIYDQLRQSFDVRLMDPESAVIPEGTRLLVLAHPPRLTEAQLRAVDAFVMAGGRLLALVDPLSEIGRATGGGPDQGLGLGDQPGMVASRSDLRPLLAAWGVDLDDRHVVADGRFAQRVDMGADAGGAPTLVTYLPWLALPREAMNAHDVATASLRQLNVAAAGQLRLKPPAGVTATPLITSSNAAQLVPVERLAAGPDPVGLIRSFRASGDTYVLAARLTGRLPSAFPVAGGVDARSAPTAVVVVADTDLLEDQMWAQPQMLLGQRVFTPFADNGAFVLNVADTLLGADTLVSLRSRGVATRPFVVMEQLRQRAERRFLDRQADLEQALRDSEQRLRTLEAQGESQEAELARVRDLMVQTRRDLRAVQRDLRAEVEGLETLLAGANIAFMPVVVVMVAAVGALWRRWRRAKARG
ncbi:Gldg family protein [Parapedomonas caeni]